MAIEVQTTYLDRLAAAVPGMDADMQTRDADTLTCESTDGIGFGLAVGEGSTVRQCVLGLGRGFRGVARRDVTTKPTDPPSDKYRLYDNTAVLTRGNIWVQVGGHVDPSTPVVFDSATGVFGTGDVPVLGARWMTHANTNELAVLRLSGEVPAAEAS